MPKTKKPKATHKPKQAAPVYHTPFYKKLTASRRFGTFYLIASILVLLATTIFWSVLGARIQQSNADQLADSYLFTSSTTLHNASFPGAHTQLLKWPIFWATKHMGFTPNTFMVVTIALSLITVGLFSWLLYKIVRRRIVAGSLNLALASVLLLVPAQPYPGGILPVNMAMITTRNIEYIVYLACLVLLMTIPRFKSMRFLLSVVVLSVLAASDKLFIDMSLAGAFLALLAYCTSRNWDMVNFCLKWLVAGVLAFFGSDIILSLVQASHLTHISSQAAVAPYSTIQSLKSFALGSIYAFFGLLTNFGANPAAHIAILRQVPSEALHGLASISAVTFVLNLIVFGGGCYVALRLGYVTIIRRHTTSAQNKLSPAALRFAMALIWTTVAGLGIFIFSNHYYPVDARYITIALFAAFAAAAVYLREKKWQPEYLVLAGVILLVGIACGIPSVLNSYRQEQAAMADTNNHNQKVEQVLIQHPVDVLVGDYWRVLPIRSLSNNVQQVTPMQSCTQPRQVLASSAWQIDLYTHSFAYLLSTDKSLTGYAGCALNQIVSAYGKPNASTLIAGTPTNPQELLLFYDKGAHKSAPVANSSSAPATVVPISLSSLPYTSCQVPTDMNVVAHQDDDLLFMNPDIYKAIQAGNCERTVYITAGDAGNGSYYWLSRQKAAEAAYSAMANLQGIWVQRIVELSSNEFITVANPQGNSKISLIFMNLPDGNLKGQGFASTRFQSIAQLAANKLSVITSVDDESTYTSSQLTSALVALMHTYQPAKIRTQSSLSSITAPDHSDHVTVSSYVTKAFKLYEQQQYNGQVTIPLVYYRGYPIRTMPQNVSGSDLSQKIAIFVAYAKFDGGVCQTTAVCSDGTNNYTAYLRREYTAAE